MVHRGRSSSRRSRIKKSGRKSKGKSKGFLIVSKKSVKGKALVLPVTFKTKKEAAKRLKSLNIKAKIMFPNQPQRQLKIRSL